MSGGARNNFNGQRWMENIIKERTRAALERFPARERHLHYNQEYKRQEALYKQERAERDRIRKERNARRSQKKAEHAAEYPAAKIPPAKPSSEQ